MRFEMPFAEAEVVRAGQAAVTARMYANATFEGVRALLAFRHFYLNPLIQTLLARTPREEALLALHYRMVAYLASIRKLDAPIHFQSTAAAARSLFELGLDMVLLSQDQSAEPLERLAAFTRVERYRVARRTVDFYAARVVPADLSIAEQRTLCADPNQTAEVEALVVRYWGRNSRGNLNWPRHWSRYPDSRSRAQQAGGAWEERYIRHYYVLSWHIHPGVVGAAGLPEEVFDIFSAEAHRLSVAVFLESLEVLGRELQLARAMPEWNDRIQFLGRVIGFALVDEWLQRLGEPRRFLYLEQHEAGVV